MCEHIQEQILHELKKIVLYYEQLREDPIDQLLVLNPLPAFVLLEKRNRTRNQMFVTASTAVIADIPGAGAITVTLSAGWNQTDLTAGTKLYTPANSNVSVLYRCTNTPLGGNVI